MLKLPIVIVNFKNYIFGEKVLEVAKICEKVHMDTGKNVAIAVPAINLAEVCNAVSIPVFAQHIDSLKPGSGTGYVLPEAVKAAGAVGTLLNHSERRLQIDQIEKGISRAQELGLITIVCASDSNVGKAISAFDSDFVAVEPPDLIGGDISVSTAQPELITDSVFKVCNGVKCEKVIVGAGVKDSKDVKIAVELGATGVLVASGVMKAESIEASLKELCEGL